jgi:hypothetical protein
MRMYDEKNVVRSLKSHPLGKVQPQSVLVEDVQPELRVAPESYGA